MCLIAFAWRAHPRYSLVLAANRDEAHARPTAALDEWSDLPGVFGGRDLEAGGSWLGLKADGRLAAVTNVRVAAGKETVLRSRGELATAFLAGEDDAATHAEALMLQTQQYGPFNLLLSDGLTLVHASNRPASHWQAVAEGVHGLSNGALDAPWPKAEALRAAVSQWIASDVDDPAPLFAALADETIAGDERLPDTGVGVVLERLLSPPFIRGRTYGTRASTVVLVGVDGVRMEERRFGPGGVALGAVTLTF